MIQFNVLFGILMVITIIISLIYHIDSRSIPIINNLIENIQELRIDPSIILSSSYFDSTINNSTINNDHTNNLKYTQSISHSFNVFDKKNTMDSLFNELEGNQDITDTADVHKKKKVKIIKLNNNNNSDNNNNNDNKGEWSPEEAVANGKARMLEKSSGIRGKSLIY